MSPSRAQYSFNRFAEQVVANDPKARTGDTGGFDRRCRWRSHPVAKGPPLAAVRAKSARCSARPLAVFSFRFECRQVIIQQRGKTLLALIGIQSDRMARASLFRCPAILGDVNRSIQPCEISSAVQRANACSCGSCVSCRSRFVSRHRGSPWIFMPRLGITFEHCHFKATDPTWQMPDREDSAACSRV